MPGITRKARVGATHISISPIGTTYTPAGEGATPQTVSESAIPTDAGAWTYLGIVSECKQKKASKKEELYGALPGTGSTALSDVIEYNKEHTITAKLGQLGPEIVGIVNNAGILKETDATLTPESTNTPHCWVKVEQYGHDNVRIQELKFLAFIDIDGDVNMSGGLSSGEITIRRLMNAQNTGALGAA
jgi:hypothetical protein